MASDHRWMAPEKGVTHTFTGNPACGVDVQVMAAEAAEFLDQAPVAEGVGAKLSRLLHGFLEAEVLPQAERAGELGLDPTPLLAVVARVLRIYADALEEPDIGALPRRPSGGG
jgi:hypothetical protein